MEQFVAPQFIDVEDKIIGPITTRQFVMIIIGGIICFVAQKLLDTISFAIVSLLVVMAIILFGFIKINGRNFYDFAKSWMEVLRRPRVRVWYKQVSLAEVISQRKKENQPVVQTDFTPSRKTLLSKHLSELSLIVDTGGRYKG
ncbi:MAG TPA: PrgI family protein [Patescibacteria group bacterium]|nr:PrgI family protein [Patescibacteria group bacterium]